MSTAVELETRLKAQNRVNVILALRLFKLLVANVQVGYICIVMLAVKE